GEDRGRARNPSRCGEAGGASPLGQRVERGEARRRLDVLRRTVLAQGADQLVDLPKRVARHFLDGLEGRARALEVLLLEKAGAAGLDEHHVDRMAGRVVQVAGDAGALLRGRETPLALRFALGPKRPLLQLRESLATEARAVSGGPGRRPDSGSEQELGPELAGDDVRPQQYEEAEHGGGVPESRTRVVTVLGDREEGDREANRRGEPVSARVDG